MTAKMFIASGPVQVSLTVLAVDAGHGSMHEAPHCSCPVPVNCPPDNRTTRHWVCVAGQITTTSSRFGTSPCERCAWKAQKLAFPEHVAAVSHADPAPVHMVALPWQLSLAPVQLAPMSHVEPWPVQIVALPWQVDPAPLQVDPTEHVAPEAGQTLPGVVQAVVVVAVSFGSCAMRFIAVVLELIARIRRLMRNRGLGFSAAPIARASTSIGSWIAARITSICGPGGSPAS
jgi:hypothetical protein